MGEPEPEEDDVITPVWPPREQIGENKTDTIVAADPLPSDRQHLRGGVHGGHRRGVLQEPGRPRPGSARKLEHSAGGREAVQRSLQLLAPREVERSVQVLRRTGAVVGDLFGQKLCELIVGGHHGTVPMAPPVALHRPSGRSRTRTWDLFLIRVLWALNSGTCADIPSTKYLHSRGSG